MSSSDFEEMVDEPSMEDAVAEEEDDNAPLTSVMDEEDVSDTILDKATAAATVSSMARLAENIAISRTSAGTTLEDIVRDLLRPMLKDWLDENLPEVIERLVNQELERLAEKASRK